MLLTLLNESISIPLLEVDFGISKLKSFINKHRSNLIVIADKHTLLDCYPLIDADLQHFIVPYGEGYKNLNSCEYIWKKLTDLDANRKSIVLCLGGGVLCDMGAFASGCYLRGIRVVLCPTSLLAMVDASVGGKNGVNFMGFKNYIGSFKEADYTFICSDFLKTLPAKEIVNGHVEMLKHGLIASRDHYNAVKIFFFNPKREVNQDLIAASIEIKKKHVAEDFRDLGVRKRLNYGHTIGHAIESWSLAISEENKALSHGVSVGLGIIAESYISNKKTGLSNDDLDEIVIVLQTLVKDLENEMPNYSDIKHYLSKDKKNEDHKVNFSLLHSIGECTENHFVDDELIEDAMNYLLSVK